MAIGILFLLFMVLCIAGILGSVLLFILKQEKANDVVLILMTAYSMVIAFLSATALPVNFVSQQVICWVIGFIAVIGAGIRFGTRKSSVLSKVLVAASVLIGIANMFLF